MERFNYIDKALLMRQVIFISVIFSNVAFAQVDTVKLQKIRFEGILEGGLVFGNTTIIGPLPERADIFMNNAKKYGTNVQFGLQTYFFNKVMLGVEYTHDKYKADYKKIASEIKSSNSNYFIQAEPKYQNSEAWSYGNYDLNYLRLSLGGNIRLTKSKYLQPYVGYGLGKGSFPSGKFAYKDNLSNNFYINDFSFNSVKASGYIVGIRYKYFADAVADDGSVSLLYSHLGIKLEVSSMNISGNGKIVRTQGVTNTESSTDFQISKNYQYITVGVFLGLGYKGKKHGRSFFFSSYPIKPWKTLKQRIQEKRKSTS